MIFWMIIYIYLHICDIGLCGCSCLHRFRRLNPNCFIHALAKTRYGGPISNPESFLKSRFRFSFHMFPFQCIWDDVSFLGGSKTQQSHSNRILIPCNQFVNPYFWLKSKMNKSRTPKSWWWKPWKPWFPLVKHGQAKPFFDGLPRIFSTGSKTSAGAESLAAPVATAAVGGWVSRQQAVHASVRRQVQHWSGMKEY